MCIFTQFLTGKQRILTFVSIIIFNHATTSKMISNVSNYQIYTLMRIEKWQFVIGIVDGVYSLYRGEWMCMGEFFVLYDICSWTS